MAALSARSSSQRFAYLPLLAIVKRCASSTIASSRHADGVVTLQKHFENPEYRRIAVTLTTATTTTETETTMTEERPLLLLTMTINAEAG
ncbi:hypothetical protein Y032_0011g1332 [Ancylostoma ceylanicum]|uniref:Uncharacterized protein n=1 Tax=Ancylostoma ceylanicum TaxID=53326 RepID=A0A016VDF8_9BILA|nr:hypothetical protein Y032_0011g1332 [Ancylostoma ceylanicum]